MMTSSATVSFAIWKNGSARLSATSGARRWRSRSCAKPWKDADLRRQLGLKPCFTPVQSPQSNGIAEALVKTLKRDYVQVTAIQDGRAALGLIEGWFEDYNESHPHSGLTMRSPREFIAAETATA